jgi:protein tyrosine/serine phosphatase
MESELYGIRNGHVVDTRLLRGGDISPVGIATLVEHGVKQVICLKNPEDDSAEEIAQEKALIDRAGMVFWSMPLNNSGKFSYSDIALVPQILQKVNSSPTDKFLIHCHKGSDRTGVVIACYRIQNGRTADRAIEEMKKYGSAWYNWGMRRAVRDFAQRKAK